jgi:ribulose-phosphate 3-epimerase
MTVEPGFGGQSFIESMFPKIREARIAVDARDDLSVWLQVDGGITPENIGRVAEAGADTFVAGSSVYSGPEPAATIEALRASAQQHSPTRSE